jgi:hypothetical protein
MITLARLDRVYSHIKESKKGIAVMALLEKDRILFQIDIMIAFNHSIGRNIPKISTRSSTMLMIRRSPEELDSLSLLDNCANADVSFGSTIAASSFERNGRTLTATVMFDTFEVDGGARPDSRASSTNKVDTGFMSIFCYLIPSQLSLSMISINRSQCPQ